MWVNTEDILPEIKSLEDEADSHIRLHYKSTGEGLSRTEVMIAILALRIKELEHNR